MQGAIGTLIGVLGKMGLTRLNAIRDHLGLLNGRVGRLEEWRDGHEVRSEDFRREVNRRFDHVEAAG